MRILRIIAILAIASTCASAALPQSPNASINGIIFDPTEKAIPGAQILAINDVTGAKYETITNGEGIYALTSLPPGPYRLQVSKAGFKTLIKPDIILNVQDAISVNFTLPIGATSVAVTVEGGAPLINTQDATVSTVVDRRFVENIPLNGRSFQTLIALTPGVVLTAASQSEQGQFSVNGQRADANYFTVDGVSANIGANGGYGYGLAQSAAGALPALSAQGGTSSLVSVDAMQEFRIQTSSFAPEFGRTPGGQVSIVTRSGTNDFHGTVFDYFRNDVLDANDWFANRDGLPKPRERQNDFGGVVGGPIVKNRTFFFFSYEGLRLRQPLTKETAVPDEASRQAAPVDLQPFLAGFPVANGGALGAGAAKFSASYSNPSSLDAYSVRFDQKVNLNASLFGRYNYAPSEVVQRGPNIGGVSVLSNTESTSSSLQTLTLGAVESFTPKISNEMRANYSNVRVGTVYNQDAFGGAVPPPFSSELPPGVTSSYFLFLIRGVGTLSSGKNVINEQRQINLTDSLAVVTGAHEVKFGVDYRWLAPFSSPSSYVQQPVFSGITGPGGVVSGTTALTAVASWQGSSLLSRNISLYGQDTWRMRPRLTLTYGLRWDINPALKGKDAASQPYTVQGLENPANLTLAPRGTPLYDAAFGSVAPRIGIAYQLRQRHGLETVIRAGFGTFYDLGSGYLGYLTAGFPFYNPKNLSGVVFPLTPEQAAPPSNATPAAGGIYVAEPGLALPRTYQWNVSLEQSLGPNQAVSATYIGSVGRELLRQETLLSPNANFGFVGVTKNSATSDYHALQLKFQRRLSRGLQTLVSYTFSHSIDIASNDSAFYNSPASLGASADRGDSDFDVRHSFTGAFSYDLPEPRHAKMTRAFLGGWSFDSFLIARSALPVNIFGAFSFQQGLFFQSRPDILPGMPLYLDGAQYAGGKAVNAGAFTAASAGQQGNAGRNILRGFGAWQADVALRRQFHLGDRLNLQFRSEFFNLFNHPNFGNPTSTMLGQAFFGQSTQSLASSMGAGGSGGGLNPLYQIGGPRSIQLALKLTF